MSSLRNQVFQLRVGFTPQQQKMKDCGAKWQDHKKAKSVKGKAEYRKFLSGCLKS